MNVFASRLKEVREKKKVINPQWIQSYVANEIGVARSTYTAYENGTKQPPLETVNKIAELLEVSTDYLLGRTDDPLGTWRPAGMDFVDDEEKPFRLSNALKKEFADNQFRIQKAAEYCGVDFEYLKKLIYEPSYSNNPDDKLIEGLSQFLNVSIDYLLGLNEYSRFRSKQNLLTEKDEKDIAKRMEKIKKDLIEGNADGDALSLRGEPMSEEAVESLLEALEHAERIATLANKKYIPKKYRKE